MQTVDDEPFETIHLYIVREEAARPSLLPIILALLTLLILLVVCITSTPEQPEEHKTIRIPAVFLPLQTFNSAVPIVPTGIKHISATAAKGFLTIYNGSIFSQQIPADMIFVGNDRIEVVVDKSADIPAGNPPYYGTAVVSAHAIAAGAKGNIQALDINEVFGSSLYIRNLQSFTGGMDAFSVKI